jgi:phosphoribosylformylglycinamidine synthase subunit PurL
MAVITPEVYTSMGLNAEEFSLIVSLLDREPTYTELGMFAVMWSEHCGYKYSRPVLAYFKQYKEALEGDGLENAGIVDIGDGLGVTMKVESHNHPSAVEPYQGAATGVGGIIRDILTMGARPIASLNSLRFGSIRPGEEDGEVVERNRYLFEHAVAGIAGYGNCVGVPTVGGEVNFHPRYSGNPLVNAMCVGILNLADVTTAGASGTGNPVIYLGSATGKDGIHGATFASDALGEDNESKRPNVQIGDPFAEKLLIEATLEALKTGAIVAIQDMGAAGLTCSTIEMASKGRVGMEVDLDLVPMREDDMTAYELMLSESQERMLCVAHLGREEEVLSVFRRWGLKAEVIGYVTDSEVVTVRRNGAIEANVNPRLLTDQCPVYRSRIEAPEYFDAASKFDPRRLEETDVEASLIRLLGSPDISSKRWVYEQFDQQVLTQTVKVCGAADAAVLAPRGTNKGLAVKLDGNGRQTFLHPYRGGQLAVAEAARNVACTGALPRAVTDGLNFGNPTMPHVYWQFERAVKGISEAAEIMQIPVISGNVSFYNESDLGEVLPTPIIGVLGVLEEATKAVGLAPKVGTDLFLLEVPGVEIEQGGLGASLFLREIHGLEDGYPVAPNLAGEKKLCQMLVEGVQAGIILSAHDTSEGGLGVALAEIAVHGGVSVELTGASITEVLFGEVPGRVIVGSDSEVLLNEIAQRGGIRVTRIGRFDANDVLLITVDGNRFTWQRSEIVRAYVEAIPTAMANGSPA